MNTDVRDARREQEQLNALHRLDEECVHLQRAGNYLQAFDRMERALVLRRHFFGADSDEVAHACRALAEMCNMLSMSFLQQDNYAVALELLKKAEILSQHHPRDKATTLNNLACYYRRLGKLHTAMTCLKKALAIETRTLRDARHAADTHLNMCAVLSQLNQHAAALEHAQAALDTLQSEFFATQKDPEQAAAQLERVSVLCIAYHNVGVEQEFLKNYEACVLSYKKGVGLAEQYLGLDHAIATTIRNSYLAAKRTISTKAASVRHASRAGGQRIAPLGPRAATPPSSLRLPSPVTKAKQQQHSGQQLPSPRSIVADALAKGHTLPPLDATPRRKFLAPEDPFFSPRYRFDPDAKATIKVSKKKTAQREDPVETVTEVEARVESEVVQSSESRVEREYSEEMTPPSSGRGEKGHETENVTPFESAGQEKNEVEHVHTNCEVASQEFFPEISSMDEPVIASQASFRLVVAEQDISELEANMATQHVEMVGAEIGVVEAPLVGSGELYNFQTVQHEVFDLHESEQEHCADVSPPEIKSEVVGEGGVAQVDEAWNLQAAEDYEYLQTQVIEPTCAGTELSSLEFDAETQRSDATLLVLRDENGLLMAEGETQELSKHTDLQGAEVQDTGTQAEKDKFPHHEPETSLRVEEPRAISLRDEYPDQREHFIEHQPDDAWSVVASPNKEVRSDDSTMVDPESEMQAPLQPFENEILHDTKPHGGFSLEDHATVHPINEMHTDILMVQPREDEFQDHSAPREVEQREIAEEALLLGEGSIDQDMSVTHFEPSESDPHHDDARSLEFTDVVNPNHYYQDIESQGDVGQVETLVNFVPHANELECEFAGVDKGHGIGMMEGEGAYHSAVDEAEPASKAQDEHDNAWFGLDLTGAEHEQYGSALPEGEPSQDVQDDLAHAWHSSLVSEAEHELASHNEVQNIDRYATKLITDTERREQSEHHLDAAVNNDHSAAQELGPSPNDPETCEARQEALTTSLIEPAAQYVRRETKDDPELADVVGTET